MGERSVTGTARAETPDRADRDYGRPSDAQSVQLWDVEFSLTVTSNAFQRWIVRCMARAGCEGLSAMDVMVLHAINGRAPRRNLSDITLLLGMEDSRPVSYAIKKLMGRKLVESRRRGKENLFSTTPTGAALCERYIQVREDFLIKLLGLEEEDAEALQNALQVLQKISSHYDHAARAVMI